MLSATRAAYPGWRFLFFRKSRTLGICRLRRPSAQGHDPKKSCKEVPVRHPLAKLCSDERGATSIEYGLIVAVVGLGLVAALSDIQAALNGILAAVSGAL